MDRPGSRASQESLSTYDPYFRQYQGPGINTGPHLHNPAQIARHVPPYSNGDPAYTWQGGGPGSGYRTLYSPQTPSRPGWSGGSLADQATEPLHASVAQIIAEVKGLAGRVTSLSEREAERDEKMDRVLARVEEIEARINDLECVVNESIGARAGKSNGGSRGVANEHPLLKVCRGPVVQFRASVLKTSARGAHDVFSDVWGGAIREQRKTYCRLVWGGTAGEWCSVRDR